MFFIPIQSRAWEEASSKEAKEENNLSIEENERRS